MKNLIGKKSPLRRCSQETRLWFELRSLDYIHFIFLRKKFCDKKFEELEVAAVERNRSRIWTAPLRAISVQSAMEVSTYLAKQIARTGSAVAPYFILFPFHTLLFIIALWFSSSLRSFSCLCIVH